MDKNTTSKLGNHTGRKIILFEDDKSLGEIYLTKLKSKGFNVVLYTDSTATPEKIVAKELPDLICLDEILPTMDGRSVVKRLRANNNTRHVPIIFLNKSFTENERKKIEDLMRSSEKKGERIEIQTEKSPEVVLEEVQKLLGSKLDDQGDTLEQVIKLVLSSKRKMPAHFTSNGERAQSFCVDFDQLTEDDEYEMASQAWGNLPNIPPKYKHVELISCLKIGEDIMIASYIASKLHHKKLVDSMKRQLIEKNIELFSSDSAKELALSKEMSGYFNFCSQFGLQRAEA